MDFSIAHEFEATPERYWRLFFDEAYNADLYQRLRIERSVLQVDEDDLTIRRRIRLEPRREIPEALRKLVPELGYYERSVFFKGEGRLDVEVEPFLMKERFSMRAVYEVVPFGPGRVRREFHGRLEIKVPLLGGQVERAILAGMRDSYETATAVTREWLRKPT